MRIKWSRFWLSHGVSSPGLLYVNVFFDSLKAEISQQPILKPFSLDLDSMLTVDASEHAAAGVLSQGGHPVAFVSHSFTPAERNWSNIEREAYAIVWCTQQLRQFLLGRQFIIQSDHRPLEFIFANHVDGSRRVSQRIARWALSLAQFDFNIKYTPGSSLPHVDGLSRLQATNQDELIFFSDLHDSETPDIDDLDSALVLQVKKLLADDTLYLRLLRSITTGNWKNVTSLETPFFKARRLLSVNNGLIYHLDRPYIPAPYRAAVLLQIHDTHMEIQQTLKKCAMSVWWPNMARDISKFVMHCDTCNKIRFRGTSSTDTWPESQPWERVHVDWAQHSAFGNILIVVDSCSSWIEAVQCTDRSTATVQRCLLEIFSRFGVPRTLVSNNGPEFVALKPWLSRMNCRKLETPAYKPSSNGTAERAVQTIKRAIAGYTTAMGSRDCYLLRILFNHRIASGACKPSPASKLLRISPRPAINPFFEIGQPVLYRNNSMKMPTEASYIIHAGRNTAWIAMGDRTRFVSVDQLRSHDVKMLPPSQDAPLSHLASTPPLQHQVSAQSTPASEPTTLSPAGPRRSQRLAQGVPCPIRYGWENDVISK